MVDAEVRTGRAFKCAECTVVGGHSADCSKVHDAVKAMFGHSARDDADRCPECDVLNSHLNTCPLAAGSIAKCPECRRIGSHLNKCSRAFLNVPQPARSTEVRIVDPKTGGEKGQKLERFDLIPFEALTALARVYGKGAQKYADDNWRKGYSWRLSLGAMLRHIALWAIGVTYDAETGEHHLSHAAWHCFTLFVFETQELGTDDRAKVAK